MKSKNQITSGSLGLSQWVNESPGSTTLSQFQPCTQLTSLNIIIQICTVLHMYAYRELVFYLTL